MGESRPGAELSRTGSQNRHIPQKQGSSWGCSPSLSATQTLQLCCGRQSFPCGLCPALWVLGPTWSPPKQQTNLATGPWQQTHEAIGQHCENLPFAPSCGVSCLFIVNCHNLSVPPVSTYAIICLRIAPHFTHPRGSAPWFTH